MLFWNVGLEVLLDIPLLELLLLLDGLLCFKEFLADVGFDEGTVFFARASLHVAPCASV